MASSSDKHVERIAVPGQPGKRTSEVDTGTPTQHRVVKEVTLLLGHLLERDLKELLGQEVPVLYEYPSSGIKGGGPAVTLINYWVERCLDRNPDRQRDEIVRPDGTRVEFFRSPPLFLSLRYLITAWWTAPEDQELLGAVMRVFHDHPYLEADPELETPNVHFEDKPLVQLSPYFSLDEMRSLCDALGMPFRRSARYDIVMRLDSERKEAFKVVRERVFKVKKVDP